MNNPNSELDAWLAGEDLFGQTALDPQQWVAGFDPDRQLVLLKIGPFQRLFLRPGKFTKRFYHQLFPLKIETWPYRQQVKLFDDFCTVDISLDVRFQATLNYVQKNPETLDSINQHIQNLYVAVIEDKINQELNKLADGGWVQKGLAEHEQRIAITVCEVLTRQQIQAEAICQMTVTFVEFPEVQLGKDSVYLHVLKRTFELNEEKNREHQRQQRHNEQQALLAKQLEIEHLKQLAEMQRQIQLAEAEAQIRLLQDKEQQLAERLEIEKRLHAVQMTHEQQLKELSFEIELRSRQELEAKQWSAEARQATERLAHEALLADERTLAEIRRREVAQKRWREADQSDNGEGGQEDADG